MRAELRDALEFLYTDSLVAARPCHSMTVDVARGAIGSIHILLNGLTEEDCVHFAVYEDKKLVRNAEWFRLVDVPVEVNTGPVGFVQKEGEHNPFVARQAPFRVYDAMAPIRRIARAVSPTMVLRLHLPTGRQTGRERRKYVVNLELGHEIQALSFVMNVHQTGIPPVGKASFPYTNWFSLALMAQRHGLEPWSEAHWRMIKRYAKLMAHARQNTFWIPLNDIFTVESQGPVLNKKRLRRIVRIFTNAGMYYIEGGHVATDTSSELNTTRIDIGLTGRRATSSGGNTDLACIARQLMEEIDRGGWHKRWIQHVSDEPAKANVTDYRVLVGMVRKYMPGFPILDATSTMEADLVGTVDICCPQPQHYQTHRRTFEAQQALGDRVWFYTCCFPGGPWLNRLLDMELVRPALLGWAAARFDLEGFLHWGLNHYNPNQDPFEKSVVKHGANNSLPAGDTHIVYPAKHRPWSSLRLEAQREGLEDYELLCRLRTKDERQARIVIRKAIERFDKYTKDVKTFRAARKAMLDAMDNE